MITIKKLIEEASKFPDGALVTASDDMLHVAHPRKKNLLGDSSGRIYIPLNGRASKTEQGKDMEGWADRVMCSPRGRIARWLKEHPAEARDIAFAAIAGLYLGNDWETVLPAHASNPRGAGSDYVDEVGAALLNAGSMGLIDKLQAEVEEGEA